MTDTTHLTTALHELYRMIEIGSAPNGTSPDDCGPYAEVVGAVQRAYRTTFETTQIMAEAGIVSDDPHAAALREARTTWAEQVRLSLPHVTPLITAMQQAVTEAGRRARMGLIEMLDALERAPDDAGRQRLALDLVDDAAALQPADLLRLKTALRETFGLPAGWVKDWAGSVRAAAKARRETLRGLVAAPETAASEAERPTWPYLVVDGRLVFCAQKADMFGGSSVAQLPIADFHARISQEQVSEDGAKHFVIDGETAYGRPFQITMDAEAFADDRRLKAVLTGAAGAQAPIAVGMAKHLGAAIQKVSGEIPTVARYTRTGWAEGRFLLPGREPEGVTVALTRKLPYGVAEDATLATGLDALTALLESHTPEVGAPLIAFLLTPPLALLAGWRNERCGAFVAGRTGSLKSSWSQAAMCLYGPGFIRDDLLVKWGQGATNNAIMSMAVAAHDLPFLIDNYKPNTGDGPRAFINLIHNIVEGGEKDRLQRNSELRDTRPIFAWPFVTGEDVPASDPASLARILVVPFTRPPGPVNASLSRAQEHSRHLSAVGNAWLTWLESDAGKDAARKAEQRFPKDREAWAKHLLSIRQDMVNVLRVASNLAVNGLAWSVLEQHPTIGPLALRYRDAYRAGLGRIADHMAAITAESLEATRYLALLRELLRTGQATLVSTTGEPSSLDQAQMIGYKAPDGGAYLLPATARRKVEKTFGDDVLNRISDKTLYSQLIDLGMLIAGKDRTTKPVYVNSQVVRVLHLSPEALADVAMDDSEATF